MLYSWRLIVWLGLLNATFTLITMGIGIAGIVIASQVIDADKGVVAEVQAAKIISDAKPGWIENTFTEIKILD